MSEIFENIYENIDEAVALIDEKSVISFKNKAFERIFGAVKDFKRLANKFYFDLCVLNTDDIVEYNPINAAIESPEDFYAYAIFQKTDKVFLHFSIKAFKDGKNKVIIFNDITEKIQNEQLENENTALKIQNKDFANTNVQAQNQAIRMALLNRISASIRDSTDISTLTMSALKELSIIFGAYKAYYASKAVNGFEIEEIYPERYKNETGTIITYDAKIRESIDAKEHSIMLTMKEYENASLLEAAVNRILIPVWGKNHLLGVAAIFTNQKSSFKEEKELLASISVQLATAMVQANLFRQIKNQKEQLESALKELKDAQLQLINSEKMASLGQLVASVAHEINTPLASINSNNDMIKMIIEKYDVPEALKEINSTDRVAIKRINNIVQSLKRFVRLDQAELQKTQVNKELDLTLDLLRHKTKNRINIIRNYAELPEIDCYTNLLNQVFMNLLMNAVQSIENQGEIIVSTDFDREYVYIKIQDSGCGIKDPERIFQTGYTTKKPGEGTGLGLAISKKIIEKHRGEISFNAQCTQGSEFIIKIPRSCA